MLSKLSYSIVINCSLHIYIGIIKRNFRGLRQDTFIMLYKSLVWSQLEYANSLWNPYQKQDIKALEKVQMRATRLITALRNKPYQERLKALGLPTLKFRRLRGDMVETYKVLSGIYDTSVRAWWPIGLTLSDVLLLTDVCDKVPWYN